jgi:hypothetical protein
MAYGRGAVGAAGRGDSSHSGERVEHKRESGCMTEGMSDVAQRDIDLRKNVLAFLHQRKRRALFVTELSAVLRKTHIANDSDLEQALSEKAILNIKYLEEVAQQRLKRFSISLKKSLVNQKSFRPRANFWHE